MNKQKENIIEKQIKKQMNSNNHVSNVILGKDNMKITSGTISASKISNNKI